jgi:hypothetical protein
VKIVARQRTAPALPVADRADQRSLSRSLAVFCLVVVLFVALRFWKLTSFSLWGGEAFTVLGARQTWAGMFSYVIADIVHPPLSYVLLKLWISLGGQSLLWLKLFPVLTGIGLVVPFYFLCQELDLQWPEMSLALFLAAVNGYMIHYAQELRMYSLLTFLAMCSFWLFMRYFRRPGQATRDLLWLTVVNSLAIYSHYYGWVVVGVELLFLLMWQRRKLPRFGLSLAVLFLAFAPWAYVVIREAHSVGGLARNLDWIPRPDLTHFLNFYATLNGPFGARAIKGLGLVLFGLPVVLWLWKIIRSHDQNRRAEAILLSWLALLSFLPITVTYLLSQWTAQALWIDRYFIFLALPYLLLVAVAANRLEPKWLRYTWIGFIVCWSLYGGVRDMRTNRMAWEGAQMGSRVQWDRMTRQLIEAESGGASPVNIFTLTVISKGLRTGDWASSTSLDYFLDSYGIDKFRFVYAKDVQALLRRQPAEPHFWIAFFEIPEWPQHSPGRQLEQAGYRVGDAIVFQQGPNRVTLLPVWRR